MKLSNKEMRIAERRYWREWRDMSDEERADAHLRFEIFIHWIDPSAKRLPWLREGLEESRRKTGPIAKQKRGSLGRVVAYVELRADTPKAEFYFRRVWYLNPYDPIKPHQIPSEARTVESITVNKKSRHPSEKPDEKPP